MLPCYFGDLCALVNALEDLEALLPPSKHQYALHQIVHLFDAVLDRVVEDALVGAPAVNNDAAPGGP